MDTKKFIMVTVSLIVGVILITGVVTPIISSVQSTGGGRVYLQPPSQTS